MDAIILGNGHLGNFGFMRDILELDNIFVIGVDGGCDYLIENGIEIDLAVGDFDSTKHKDTLSNVSSHLKTDMNISDLEFAINYCLDRGFDKLYLFGFTGKRSDHFLFNLKCIANVFENNLQVLIIDEFNVLTLIKGEKAFDKGPFKFFSIIPIYDDTVISISGSKYDLVNERIDLFGTLTLSNEWEEEKVKIHSSKLVYICLVF